MVSTLKPIVGMVFMNSPNFSIYKAEVRPEESKPSIIALNSWFPNNRLIIELIIDVIVTVFTVFAQLPSDSVTASPLSSFTFYQNPSPGSLQLNSVFLTPEKKLWDVG